MFMHLQEHNNIKAHASDRMLEPNPNPLLALCS
jgi:hypothetical protein